ncbi:nicotinate-nucleotide--dimethylbenzimidazole phosphoribosyltransferase [Pseudodesulfovibrio sp. zrk46]|uniref:nicotinate-nucleotide--dimethylbenzimidazole phosphoribosyltransferase n=1 Tax=Pseudodesulfovibrio sp. zrk46 TaxID=2725288 RepID=UPI0014490675|nr:nicotinate-nucleotide--dimethylbenzimidazole phosphoribosyltransferase [Pseudodesulfovibrio sp. zrk46]QJB57447.1 nicotinate-nucleotide--dimethylbenzimidazole phosphoribosyltransferase [Pseudodesulfovibrio sp. zrk46]
MDRALEMTIANVEPLDASLRQIGQSHLDNLTKPKGSLGRLEELALQLFLIQGGNALKVDPMRIYTVAADHGVNAEGVSVYPQEVTRQMVTNSLAGGSGIAVLAETANVELVLVDVGSCGGVYDDHPHLIQDKIADGTANLVHGPAMTREQCLCALNLGISLADKAREEGIKVLGTGELGISNTTPSTALYCAYLGIDPDSITGPGGGLRPEGVKAKAAIVKRGLDVDSKFVNTGDALDVLMALGGLEIAALAGMIIGGAKNRQLVCVDGFISTAAYVAAWKLCPVVKDYCIISHASAEPGHKVAMETLAVSPLLDLDMRLGEGTGAAVAMFFIRAAANIFNDMASFADAGVAEASK